MKKKMISVLTLALTGMLVLGGCKKVETPPTTTENTESAVEGYIKASDPSKNPVSERKDTLVIGINAPEEVFNPLYAESAYDVYVTSTIFEGMLTADENGMPIEALAEKYSISDDGLKYTFTLKEGLKFSDGSPLTTEDVAFTYTVGSDATYDGPTDFVNSTKIKGAKAYKEGTASTIEGINIVDDKTIEFTLEEPNADAIYDFGAGILSKAYYGKDYKQGNLDYIKGFHKTPLGAGQYKLVKTVAGQEVDLVANENYHKGEPKIPNLIYKVTSEETRMQMLQTGEIDMDMVTVNQDNVQALKDAQFIDLHIFPTNGYGYIGFNFKNPKFQDQKVRQALAYGLNRKEVVDAVYAGGFADVINVPQSKLSWAYYKGDNAYEFNKDKAIELLEEAGWKVGADGIREKDGVKLEIKFTASSPNPVNDALIPVAQANYKEIGVKFEAEQMDFNAVLEKVDNGSVEMYFMAWGLTPAADATGVFGTDGAQNKISYSNAKVDELLAKGLRETDIEKRKEIYKELYTVLNEDLPYIFLYQRRDMWAVNSRVKGFEDQITPYKDFTQSLYKLTLE